MIISYLENKVDIFSDIVSENYIRLLLSSISISAINNKILAIRFPYCILLLLNCTDLKKRGIIAQTIQGWIAFAASSEKSEND